MPEPRRYSITGRLQKDKGWGSLEQNLEKAGKAGISFTATAKMSLDNLDPHKNL